VKPRALLARLAAGSVRNVRFADFDRLLTALKFRCTRIAGSHQIYSHPEVPELLNLQPVDGEAKPYQIRQLLRIVERYDLRMDDDS
jgi:hypothetical protein